MHILNIIDKTTLAELSIPSDKLAIRDLLYRIAGEAVLLSSALLLFDNWLFLSLLLFYASAIWHGFWGYAGIGHEFYHSRVFSKPAFNKVLYRIASYLTWNNPEFFRQSHNYHHRNTFAADDGEAFGTQDWRPLTIVLYLTVDLPLLFRRIFYALINSAGLTIQDGALLRIGWSYQFESILMLGIHSLIHLGLFLAFHAWHLNAMWFLLPFTGQFFNRLLAQSQHVGLSQFKDEGPLKHSRSLPLPGLIQFLYAGMNFHVEHHLAPAIPYYKLPKLNALLVEKKLLAQLDATLFFRKSIWLAIRKAQ